MCFNLGRTERTIDEKEAAGIVASLQSNTSIATKRKREHCDRSLSPVTKHAKSNYGSLAPSQCQLGHDDNVDKYDEEKPTATNISKKPAGPPLDATGLIFTNPELKPAPFFYYSDHSLEQDDDPLTPVTAAGRIPTFPAKMHAILTNPALQDVVAWAPHGRSWRILKPRDFEVNVLPRYFEHSKFSSFVRQANGWGFRRLAQGRDRNAYYHEYFLRSMPWLCKKMRRPKVAEKKAIDPDMEPDFDAISAVFPVPSNPITREILIVQQTIEKGPRARMPVHWATDPLESLAPPSAPFASMNNVMASIPAGIINNGFGDLKPAAATRDSSVVSNSSNDSTSNSVNVPKKPNIAACPVADKTGVSIPPALLSNLASVASSSNGPDSQFAAGFMAATAYHSKHIHDVLGKAFASGSSIPGYANGNSNMVSNEARSMLSSFCRYNFEEGSYKSFKLRSAMPTTNAYGKLTHSSRNNSNSSRRDSLQESESKHSNDGFCSLHCDHGK
mmetsp:Transcript_17605/g.35838  ORF Transcript_17605/g.35838 Transcript_17605/m.35838 type:complete len:501 (-) Transcript_17605:226-1728(-)